VTAERRQLEPRGQAAGGPERCPQAVEPASDRHAAKGADADVQEVALREVPSVAVEVGLRKEFGRAVARCQRAQEVGPDARLALLRDHHVLLPADLAERPCHGAMMPSGADDDRRRHRFLGRLHDDAARHPVQRAHTLALAHRRPRGRGAAEQEGVELGAHYAVARDVAEPGLVLLTIHRDRDRLERLDGLGVLGRVEVEVAPDGGRHPTGTELDARKARGVEHQHARARARQLPRGRAAPGSAAHHYGVESHASRVYRIRRRTRTPVDAARRRC
jgi:hypothetical protein